jgi:hypothetical protein
MTGGKAAEQNQVVGRIETIRTEPVSERGGHRMAWRWNLVLWKLGESAGEENCSDPKEETITINHRM